MITRVEVYGLRESIRASKYPKAVDVNAVNDEMTKTVVNLASCGLGEGHDNFLNGIIVQFDLTLPIKVWVELQRYHFIDFVSSQSTMHKIAKMDIGECCNEYVWHSTIDRLKELQADYNEHPTKEKYMELLFNIPTGFKLTARMTTNYRQLKTIYRQRKNHQLNEWREFCKWIESLPYAKEMICNG